jgi:hypothetical protein
MTKAYHDFKWSDPRRVYEVGGGIMDTRYPTPLAVVTEEMLQHEAFEIPLDTLQDMWLHKFGNTWVDMEALEDDMFFRIAAERLRSTGRLESHYLTDRARFVCRKPE